MIRAGITTDVAARAIPFYLPSKFSTEISFFLQLHNISFHVFVLFYVFVHSFLQDKTFFSLLPHLLHGNQCGLNIFDAIQKDSFTLYSFLLYILLSDSSSSPSVNCSE